MTSRDGSGPESSPPALAVGRPRNERLAFDPRDDPRLPVRWLESRRFAAIRELVGARPGMRIVEVGCSAGHVLSLFPEAEITGIDRASHYIRQARDNLAGYRASFVLGDLQQMPSPPSGFDRILCNEVLEHAEQPEALLAAMRRMLSPGGRAVIIVPNEPLVRRLTTVSSLCPYRLVPPTMTPWGGQHLVRNAWTRIEVQRLLARWFHVLREVLLPLPLLPLRACFLCAPKS